MDGGRERKGEREREKDKWREKGRDMEARRETREIDIEAVWAVGCLSYICATFE